MSLRVLTSTSVRLEIVLATDEAVSNANDQKALTDYISTGDASGLVIPDDATRLIVRPLSQPEIHAALQEADAVSPGAELRAAAILRRGDGSFESEEDLKAAIEFHDYLAVKNFALIKRGLVGIVGEALAHDEAAMAFHPESERGIYPLSLRAEMRGELSTHIQRVSDLGPLAVSRYSLPSGSQTPR